MTCPDTDVLLDLGLDAPADLRAHVASCDACTAELAASMALAASFAEMRAETAPAELIDAVLTTAPLHPTPRATRPRRGDRPARRSRTRRVLWTGVLASLCLTLIVWLVPGTGESPDPTVEMATVALDVQPQPTPVPRESLAPNQTSAPERAAAPIVPPPPGPRAPTASTAEPALPESAEPASTPLSMPDTGSPVAPEPQPEAPAPDSEQIAATTAPADSVAIARDGALLALGLVADAQRVARRSVAAELERIGTTVSDATTTPHVLIP